MTINLRLLCVLFLIGAVGRAADYVFSGGYPSAQTVQQANDDADLIRAIRAYKFFYPTVSGAALFSGNAKVGIIPNKVSGTLDSKPKHVGFTLNSDTPYAPLLLNLKDGPIVVEIPAGPLISIAMDIHQHWVADLGIPGPDAGKGGKYVFLPPGYTGPVPTGYYTSKSTSYRMLAGVRGLPVQGDVKGAVALIKKIKIYPLNPVKGWKALKWLDLTPAPQDTTPLAWENNLQYWQVLQSVIDYEPAYEPFRNALGDLAALGIVKGQPFAPDARLKGILEKAAKMANEQMRVASFADRRPDRIVWQDRKWEWAALRFEDGDFNKDAYADLEARDKWFYQAIGTSPKMFLRNAGAGSLYWLGTREKTGAFLDGSKTYKLTVPLPVPGKLFWSVTVYDTQTRSQVITDQGKAALRSLFELKGKTGNSIDLYFGPQAPAGHEKEWIKTLPGKGWFVYFRIYGPEGPAFDGSWKPGDFEAVK